MKLRSIMWVTWPAFLVAGILEMLLFAMVEPKDLSWMGQPLALSSQGVYTVSFFVLWIVTMAASSMTLLLSRTSEEINQPSEKPTVNEAPGA